MQAAFPNCDVYSAYSSRIILQKRGEQGEKVHSVTEVLEYLRKKLAIKMSIVSHSI